MRKELVRLFWGAIILVVFYFSWLIGGLFGELTIPKYSHFLAWKILQPFVGLAIIVIALMLIGALCEGFKRALEESITSITEKDTRNGS